MQNGPFRACEGGANFSSLYILLRGFIYNNASEFLMYFVVNNLRL